MLRAMLLLITVLGVALPLAGCGRKGAPRPPGPPAQVSYPKAYPNE